MIKSLECKNFGQFKELPEIPFDTLLGLIGITGKNGAGKSTLISLISVAFYGLKAYQGGNKDEIRTVGEKGHVLIRLCFDHQGKDLYLQREYKGKNLKPEAKLYSLNPSTGEADIIAEGESGVTDYITNTLLNMDCETFINSIFCRQGELDKLSNMRNADLRAFILKLSGVEKLDKDLGIIRKEKKTAHDLLEFLEKDLGDKETIEKKFAALLKEISEMEKELMTIKDDLDKKEISFNNIKALKENMDEKYEKYNASIMSLNKGKAQMESLNGNENRIQDEIKKLDNFKLYMNQKGNKILSDYDNLVKLIETLERNKVDYIKKSQLYKNITQLKEKILSSKEKIKKLMQDIRKLNYSKDEVININNQLSDFEQSLEQFRNKKSEVNSQLLKIKSDLAHIGQEFNNISNMKGCTCPTCKQIVSEEYIHVIEQHYTEEQNKLQNELAAKNNEQANIEKEIQAMNTNIQNCRNRLNELAEIKNQYSVLVSTVNTIKESYTADVESCKKMIIEYKPLENVQFDENKYNGYLKMKQKYSEAVKKIYIIQNNISKYDSLVAQREDITDKKAKGEKYLSDLQLNIDSLGFVKEDYDKIKTSYNQEFNNYNQIKDKYMSLNATYNAKTSTEKTSYEDRLEKLKAKEHEYQMNKDLHLKYTLIEESLIKTKQNVTIKIVPMINKHFSPIFRELMDGKYEDIKLDKDYNILVYQDMEPCPISRLSGGEQAIANLSLRLSVSKFLDEMRNNIIDLIALDEIFSSLDDDRKANLLDVIAGIKKHFKQVLIISHEDSIKSQMDVNIHIEEDKQRHSRVFIEA